MKKIMVFAVTVIIGIMLMGCSLFSTETTTTTEPFVVDTDNFIEINTVTDLQSIEMNKSYILMSDLDLYGIDWTPLGSLDVPYQGIFDGNGHTISHLSINQVNEHANGLFGYLKGEVKDLNITNFFIKYDTDFLTYAGGLAGYLIGDVSNVTASGTISITNSGSNTFAGLLVGQSQALLEQSTTVEDFTPNLLENNTVSGNIIVDSNGYGFVGGLVGKGYNTEFINNQASGTISVTGDEYNLYVGGLIGHYYGGILVGFEDQVETTELVIQNNIADENITVTNAYAGASVGGLIGYSKYGNVSDNVSLSKMDIEGDTLYVGGYIGENWESKVANVLVNQSVLINNSDLVNYSLSTVIGKIFSETNISNAFYIVDSESQLISRQGTETTLTDLQSASFYENNFSWQAEFYNKILDILNS